MEAQKHYIDFLGRGTKEAIEKNIYLCIYCAHVERNQTTRNTSAEKKKRFLDELQKEEDFITQARVMQSAKR
jgi:hypothetical protein